MTTWPALAPALEARPGWRRDGREWHGPCPLTGEGRDCCWAGPGADGVSVLLGCRRCGGRLDRTAFRAHLAALAPCGPLARPQGRFRPPARPPGPRRPRTAPGRDHPDPDPIIGAVLAAAGPADGSPGARYLAARGAWSGGALPYCVRWLAADRAPRALRPRLPVSCEGALVYLFLRPPPPAAEGGSRPWPVPALQLEAVTADGARASFLAPGGGGEPRKRPAVRGSRFAGGAAFRPGPCLAPPGRAVVVEGPLDALAVVGAVQGARVAVVGVPGAGGFQRAAVAGWDRVTIAPDADDAGAAAGRRLADELEAAGVTWRMVRPAGGGDWTDEALRRREVTE